MYYLSVVPIAIGSVVHIRLEEPICLVKWFQHLMELYIFYLEELQRYITKISIADKEPTFCAWWGFSKLFYAFSAVFRLSKIFFTKFLFFTNNFYFFCNGFFIALHLKICLKNSQYFGLKTFTALVLTPI